MYKNGVSNAATNILKINAEKTSPTNCDQSSIWKIVKKKITEKESINWEVNVEKLFLSHKCFPFVKFFQKW